MELRFIPDKEMEAHKQRDELVKIICYLKKNKEVLQGLADGLTQRQIAKIIFRDVRTVEGRCYAMRKKLRCKTNYQLLAKAFRLKIIE